MSSFGADLKREREAKGISLKEISDRTKIGVRLLKALEEEQLEQLPGGIFDRSFLRQYARYLGLDEDQLLGEYLKVTGATPEAATQHSASASPEQKSASYRTSGGGFSSSTSKSLLGNPVLGSLMEDYGEKGGNGRLILILVCLAAVIGAAAFGVHWYLARRANAETPQTEGAYPGKEAAAPLTSPAQPADSQPVPETAGGASTAGSPPGGTQDNAGIAGNPATPPAGPESVTPATTPAANMAPKTAIADTNKAPSAKPALASVPGVNEPFRPEPAAGRGAAGAALVLQIDARKECWVSVAADGQKQWQGTMRAATTRRVEARESVALTLGDAGAVTLTLNGKPLTFAGRSGEVKTLNISSNGVTQTAP